MFKLFILILLLAFYHSSYADDYQTGGINISQFSWVIDGNNIKITSAMATAISYPNSTLCGYDRPNGKPTYLDVCGVAIFLQKGSPYIFSSSSGAGFTAQSGTSAINSVVNKSFPLSYFGLSSVDSLTRACLYIYKKSRYQDGIAYMGGVCSGGGVPPQQTATVKCTTSINNNVIDFGNIPASEFIDAGAGNTPESVRPQAKTVNIKCENAEKGTKLKINLKANKSQGNILVSDNQDVGFIINNDSGQHLIPNNTGSNISASLDSNQSTSIAISAAPVSVTGKKPATGLFTTTATLEVIND
ncbi:fimbrial protein [Klebsiella electrica]